VNREIERWRPLPACRSDESAGESAKLLELQDLSGIQAGHLTYNYEWYMWAYAQANQGIGGGAEETN